MKNSYNIFKLGSFLVLFFSFILASVPAVYAEEKAEEAATTAEAGDATTTDEKKGDGEKKGKGDEEPECE